MKNLIKRVVAVTFLIGGFTVLMFAECLPFTEPGSWQFRIVSSVLQVCNDADMRQVIVGGLLVNIFTLILAEGRLVNVHVCPDESNFCLFGFVGLALLGSTIPAWSVPVPVLGLLTCILVGKIVLLLTHKPSDAVETQRRKLLAVAGIITLISVAAICQPVGSNLFRYRGVTRWSGLWHNPNTYGLLMGTALVLAVGLGLQHIKGKPGNSLKRGFDCQDLESSVLKRLSFVQKIHHLASILIIAAAGVAGIGLVRSYSRGAWLATTLGLFEALCHSSVRPSGHTHKRTSKIRGERRILDIHGQWRLFAGMLLFSAILVFWEFREALMPLTQRAFSLLNQYDFSRNNRVAGWEGALQMMADQPWFGFGWTEFQLVYDRLYRPTDVPDGAAIRTNDFAVLGATLGLPALFCFAAYVFLRLRLRRTQGKSVQSICRAGVIVLLVGFLFDGGLFKLSLATPFWILLELGFQGPPEKAILVPARACDSIRER